MGSANPEGVGWSHDNLLLIGSANVAGLSQVKSVSIRLAG